MMRNLKPILLVRSREKLNILEEIRQSLSVKENNGKKSLKHSINKKVVYLPFQTRNPERAKFGQGFDAVLGQFFRNVEQVKANSDSINKNELINLICESVKADEDSRQHLEKIIDSYLFNSDAIQVFHPSMYKYIFLSDTKESVGEKEIAKYLYDALLENNSNKFEDFLGLNENEHVLTRLIKQHMPVLAQEESQKKYAPMYPFVKTLFQEDLEILLSNRDFFMKNIHLFFAYYYFYSISQVSLKLNQFEKVDETSPTPIYFNLDWEASNRNRMAVNMGYKVIMNNARRILSHVNTLEHLNFIFEAENYNYLKLFELFQSMDETKQEEKLDLVYQWTKEYSDIVLGNSEEIEKKITINDAFRQLQSQLLNGLSKETSYRYALAIHEIAKIYFLKTRGALGNVLNVTQDFLILLTAISVKKEKITLKQLFIEFEKRGVFFDRYSQEGIIELFNKLNLIEKKSDSGDAQYVKPIL